MFLFGFSIGHLCLMMGVNMDVDRSSLYKLAVTVSAGIGLYTSVKTLVIQKSSPGCESFPTKFADIRPLACMSSFVFFDDTSVNRAEVAVLALKYSFWLYWMKMVCMIFEPLRVLKGYSTLLTDHRIHHMMSSFVGGKM